MLTGVIFARWLKPEGFGLYSLAYVVVNVGGGLGAFGMDIAAGRYIAYYLGKNEAPLVRTLLRFGMVRALVVSLTVGGLLFGLLRSGWLSATRFAPLVPLSGYIALAVPVVAAQMVLLQSILALHRVKTRVTLEKLLYPLLRLVLPFPLFWCLHDRARAATASILASSLVVLAAAVLITRYCLREIPSEAPVTTRLKSEWFRFALPFVFFNLQAFVSAGMGIDVVLVGALASVSDSGIYAAAFRFTIVLLLARSAMDYAFGPQVGRLYGEGDLQSIQSLYKASSAVGLAWTLPFAIVIVCFSRSLMVNLFGPAYAEGALALALLVLGFTADGAAGCNTTLLSMVGKPWLVFANGFTGGVLSISLCLLLIPRHGIAGAAIAVSVARCTATAMSTFEIWRLYKLHPFSTSLLKLLTAGLFTSLLGYYCNEQLRVAFAHNLMHLAFVIGFVLLSYAVALRLTRFSIQSC